VPRSRIGDTKDVGESALWRKLSATCPHSCRHALGRRINDTKDVYDSALAWENWRGRVFVVVHEDVAARLQRQQESCGTKYITVATLLYFVPTPKAGWQKV